MYEGVANIGEPVEVDVGFNSEIEKRDGLIVVRGREVGTSYSSSSTSTPTDRSRVRGGKEEDLFDNGGDVGERELLFGGLSLKEATHRRTQSSGSTTSSIWSFILLDRQRSSSSIDRQLESLAKVESSRMGISKMRFSFSSERSRHRITSIDLSSNPPGASTRRSFSLGSIPFPRRSSIAFADSRPSISKELPPQIPLNIEISMPFRVGYESTIALARKRLGIPKSENGSLVDSMRRNTTLDCSSEGKLGSSSEEAEREDKEVRPKSFLQVPITATTSARFRPKSLFSSPPSPLPPIKANSKWRSTSFGGSRWERTLEVNEKGKGKEVFIEGTQVEGIKTSTSFPVVEQTSFLDMSTDKEEEEEEIKSFRIGSSLNAEVDFDFDDRFFARTRVDSTFSSSSSSSNSVPFTNSGDSERSSRDSNNTLGLSVSLASIRSIVLDSHPAATPSRPISTTPIPPTLSTCSAPTQPATTTKLLHSPAFKLKPPPPIRPPKALTRQTRQRERPRQPSVDSLLKLGKSRSDAQVLAFVEVQPRMRESTLVRSAAGSSDEDVRRAVLSKSSLTSFSLKSSLPLTRLPDTPPRTPVLIPPTPTIDWDEEETSSNTMMVHEPLSRRLSLRFDSNRRGSDATVCSAGSGNGSEEEHLAGEGYARARRLRLSLLEKVRTGG